MSLFKRMIKKGYFFLFPNEYKNPVDVLIKNGNVKIGKNCDISGLQIEINTPEQPRVGKLNIEIGNDCHLLGKIVLYNENAKIRIGDRVFIGPETSLISIEEIEIESDILISWGCTIMDNDSHSLLSIERATDVVDWKKGIKKWEVVARKKIKIERKSWIGFNAIVLKGVTIQEGTIVASGSVVTKTFDPFSVIGGNPAKFIKRTE